MEKLLDYQDKILEDENENENGDDVSSLHEASIMAEKQ
jgi:hypothetical protein